MCVRVNISTTEKTCIIVVQVNRSEHSLVMGVIIDEVREGDEVEFDLQEGKKGLNAVNVRVI